MSQLTQQIAGAYINAQVEREGIIEPLLDACSFHLSEYKLILTPLSAISDEDAVEVAKMLLYTPEARGKHTAEDVMSAQYQEHDSERFFLYADMAFPAVKTMIYELPYEVADYLRSRNYDLGYMGIRSLIDAGIAISSLDKTETK